MLTGKQRLQVWVRDRRRAALHESGHVVLLEHFGVQAWGYIFTTVNPGPYDKFWVGKTHHGEAKLPGLKRCMVAVAGAVAELGEEELVCPEWLGEFWEDPDQMSATDWAAAECEPGEPDRTCLRAIEAVARLLAPGTSTRAVLHAKAREMIVVARCVPYAE